MERDDTPGSAPPGRVSERDRDYMRRLGEWERENDEIATREHLALSLEERLLVSWKLQQQLGHTLHEEPYDNWPELFYERARRLGLIRKRPGDAPGDATP